MITIKPILEPEVLEIFNKGRFFGELEGTIVSDGTGCLGHCLWRLEESVAVVLEAQVKQPSLLDGVIRASLAVAQNAGATAFWVEDGDPALTRWRTLTCPQAGRPIPFSAIFHAGC